MPRMRTISQTVQYLKQQDPDTAIGDYWLRQKIKSGELKYHIAGHSRYLIDLDYLEAYLSNPPAEVKAESVSEYGKIRRIGG